MITHDIAEAVSLANRVVVLSKRPASSKKIYNLEFGDTEDPIIKRSSREFNYYYSLIWKDLDNNVV